MMTNKWWTRDTSLTTENEKNTSDTHEGETIVNDLPKKVKSVLLGLGWGALIGNIMCYGIVHVCACLYYVLYMYVIMRRTELLIAKNITPSYVYMYTIYTHVAP